MVGSLFGWNTVYPLVSIVWQETQLGPYITYLEKAFLKPLARTMKEYNRMKAQNGLSLLTHVYVIIRLHIKSIEKDSLEF